MSFPDRQRGVDGDKSGPQALSSEKHIEAAQGYRAAKQHPIGAPQPEIQQRARSTIGSAITVPEAQRTICERHRDAARSRCDRQIQNPAD
jgi:hypothetical protein